MATRGLEPTSPIYRFASVVPALKNKGQLAFLGTAKDAAGKNLVTLWPWLLLLGLLASRKSRLSAR